MYQGVKIPASKSNADTRDIINALARILPAATKQAEQFTFLRKTGDPINDALTVGRYVQNNFTYIKDGLLEQNIKTPGAMLATKTGDCKSFALFIAAVLSAWKYKNGLRFAGYNGSGQPTHVYNFILTNENKMFTFDACLPGLQESPNATLIEDMQVNHIAGVPVLNEISTGIYGRAERKARRQQRREDRQERREERRENRQERREEGRGFFQGAKKIALAPARGAFLLVLKANFRGLASRFAKVPAEKLAGFWGKLGGDKNKLNAAINDGKGKKPLLGMGEGPNGEPVYNVQLTRSKYYTDAERAERLERRRRRSGARGNRRRQTYAMDASYIGVDPVTTAAATGAPIIIAAVKFLKDLGIDPGDVLDAVKKLAPDAEPLGDFEATDAETAEAAGITKQSPFKNSSSYSPNTGSATRSGEAATDNQFKINPLLLVGVAGAAFLLLKKKKGKK
jgi:hypothetical protein